MNKEKQTNNKQTDGQTDETVLSMYSKPADNDDHYHHRHF